jgi:hypothetical protein
MKWHCTVTIAMAPQFLKRRDNRPGPEGQGTEIPSGERTLNPAIDPASDLAKRCSAKLTNLMPARNVSLARERDSLVAGKVEVRRRQD